MILAGLPRCLVRAALLLSLIFPIAQTALGFGGYTALGYSQALSGYSETWADPFDIGEENCEYIELGYYYCEGYALLSVHVRASLHAPGGSAADYGYGTGPWYAYTHVGAGAVPGVWTAIGQHSADMRYYAYYCAPYQGCGGYDEQRNEYLGQTGAQVFVPPPSVPVEIEYTMFIPLDHIAMALVPFIDHAIFDGDSVDTYTSGSTYRIQQRFGINLASKTVASHIANSGNTHEYTPAWHYEPFPPAITPLPTYLSASISCFRKFCPECPYYPGGVGGHQIVFSGLCKTGTPTCSTEATDMQTIKASVTNSSGTSVTVRFEGDPGNACVAGGSLAADISWENELTISWNGQTWMYELSMDHDGFPKHEVRINGALVYAMDPIEQGQTPMSLGWPREFQPAPIIDVLP